MCLAASSNLVKWTSTAAHSPFLRIYRIIMTNIECKIDEGKTVAFSGKYLVSSGILTGWTEGEINQQIWRRSEQLASLLYQRGYDTFCAVCPQDSIYARHQPSYRWNVSEDLVISGWSYLPRHSSMNGPIRLLILKSIWMFSRVRMRRSWSGKEVNTGVSEAKTLHYWVIVRCWLPIMMVRCLIRLIL